MIDSKLIEPHGGATGLYRLMFWHQASLHYVFPPFSEDMELRLGASCLRPHSLAMCKLIQSRLRDYSRDSEYDGLSVIITPFPI